MLTWSTLICDIKAQPGEKIQGKHQILSSNLKLKSIFELNL